jgi:hypothetical protein
MEGSKNQPPRAARPKSKTPAERSVEFTATQRRLKEEATARRASGAKDGDGKKKG